MSAIRLGRPRWAIIFITIMMASFVAAVAFLRIQDMHYATAVSDMSYRFCKDLKNVDNARFCEADARQTYNLMDPGAGKALAPATIGVALLWTIVGLLVSAFVFVIRFYRKASE